jgi:exodeoxyribonuclease VII large subunit
MALIFPSCQVKINEALYSKFDNIVNFFHLFRGALAPCVAGMTHRLNGRTGNIQRKSSMDLLDISQTQEIYTVTRLAREVKFTLEGNFPFVWVEGEISNFSAPNSGHWYFSIKDNNAQIRCAMFRMNNRLVVQPKEGSHVLIKARVSLYEGRGDFQLIVEHLEEIGEGKLRQAFDALKKKLFEAGLFDEKHKKSLPDMPKTIGVITSPTGAAIRDILSVLGRRFPHAPVILYPSLVQGETAANNLVQAIKLANKRKECDVIILSRGGGSLEDLWPFNEEIVAHAIFESELPTVSGVGHEVDFTIADFVADVRAPTPSAAAELVAPHSEEILQSLTSLQSRLTRLLQLKFAELKKTLQWHIQQLQQQHPKKRFAEQAQRLDQAEATLIRLQQSMLATQQNRLRELALELQLLSPAHQIKDIRQTLHLQMQTLKNLMLSHIETHQTRLGNLSGKLDALSPLATLQRGFSIVTAKDKVITTTKNLKTQDKVHVRLATGALDCVIEKINS